jgi:hypothetical protein
MEPVTRSQQEPNSIATAVKNLLMGAVMGAGVYLVWVIAHAILFGG